MRPKLRVALLPAALLLATLALVRAVRRNRRDVAPTAASADAEAPPEPAGQPLSESAAPSEPEIARAEADRLPLGSRQLQGTAFVIFALVAATVAAGTTWRSLASPVAEQVTALAAEQRPAPASPSTPEVEVTIRPGMRAEEVAVAIAAVGAGDPDTFLELVRQPRRFGLESALGAEPSSLEGYLHPGTYETAGPGSEAELVREMVGRANRAFSAELRTRAESMGLTRHEVVTLASIVEREAGLDSERPVIAGVFHRRLAEGLKLESDPTTHYMVDTRDGPTGSGYWKWALRASDLREPDPYNTYATPGLPPGPIATPSIDSIRAALYPADFGYRFFFSRGEATTFSRTFDEHLDTIAAVRGGGAEQSEPASRLQRLVERSVAPLDGHVGVVVKHLTTGESARHNADDFFTTASLYKLGVLLAAFDAREAGDLYFEEAIPVAGATSQLSRGPATEGVETLVVRDAIEDMIVTSSNPSALALLARLGRAEIESVLRREGLHNTALTSSSLLTTPADVARLLEDLAEARAVNAAASAEMVDILRGQQIDDRLPLYLPKDVDVAHKTGDLVGLRHDAGILFLDSGPVVVVAMVEETSDTETANWVIGRLARAVYEYFEEYLPAEAAFAADGTGLCELDSRGAPGAGALAGMRIVLDPGHGGVDPGATFEFADGYVLQEKDVNLAASRLLANRLVEHGASVRLTRCDDASLSPVERAALVNSGGADIALSLHVNHSDDPTFDGTAVFQYSAEGEALANYLIGSTAQPGLWDALGSSHPLPNLGVSRDWLEFLVHADVAAALTESLYLSNPAEAELLRSALAGAGSRIDEIAEGHLAAVLAYTAADRVGSGNRSDPIPVGATRLEQLLYRRVDEAGGRVALTFDDCVDRAAWERILATLEQERLTATFFCTTRTLLAYPDLAKRTAEAGHTLGSHTHEHARLEGLSRVALRGQFALDQEAWNELRDTTGVTRMPFFRPPFGDYDERTLAEAQRAGFERIVLWDVDTEDWKTDDPSAVVRPVIDEATDGSIVLLHVLDTTADALPDIAAHLRTVGLRGVDLVELFDSAVSTPGTAAAGVSAPETSPTGATGPDHAADSSGEHPAREHPAPSGAVTITAVGDIVMGTTTKGMPKQGAGFFDDVRASLAGDVVLGNLEGTLSTGGSSRCEPDPSTEDGAQASEPRAGCYAFQTPPEAAHWLRGAGFTVVNLANNHTYDYGAGGMSQTLGALAEAGVDHTGLPGQMTLQRVGETVVAIVGFAPHDYVADLRDIAGAQQLVRRAAETADLVVVTMHAGIEGPAGAHVKPGKEVYLGKDRGDTVAFAHAVIDAGADLVVGHGPHVLRGLEWYRERLIAYSLGNFAAYNVFYLEGPRQVSGILRVKLNADGSWAGGKLVPTYLRGKGIPTLDPDRRALQVVHELSADDFGESAVSTARGRLAPPGEARPDRDSG